MVGYGFSYSHHIPDLASKTLHKMPYIWILLYPVIVGMLMREYYDKTRTFYLNG